MKKKILVIDTSVMVKWANSQDEEDLDQANRILEDIHDNKVKLLSTELAKYEIGNALLYKNMELPQTKAALGVIYALPIDFVPLSKEAAEETLTIAKSHKITYYDAAFISLAKDKNATLVTANPKHQRPLPGLKVTNLRDY